MSIVSGLMIVLALSGAVDPTSARARARRHEAALVTAEAALLAGDASAALAAVHTIDADDRRLDQRRLRQVRARALLGVGDAAAARVDLIALLTAADDGTADDIRRQLAEAERSIGNFDACDDALAGLVVVGDVDRIARATCLRGTTRRAQAHDVLADGAAVPLRRLRLQLWLEDGAPRQARPDAFALVDTQPARDVLAWARAFGDAGDDTAARALVEGLVGRADLDIETASGVARLLATGGRSQVLQASLLLPGLADARREQGDVAGAWRAAVALAGSDRLRQRAALLVDAGAWERLWLLWPRLKAAGLADDDEVAYAVAFAAVTTDRLDEAEAVLDGVTGAATFARATALQARIKSLQACRSSATRESPCTP